MTCATNRPLVEKTEASIPSWGNADVSGSQGGVTAGPVLAPHEAWNPGRSIYVASTEDTGLVPRRRGGRRHSNKC